MLINKKTTNKQNKITELACNIITKIIKLFKKLNKYNRKSSSTLVKLEIKNLIKNSISCINA